MDREKQFEKAAQALKDNPDLKEVFVTGDGKAFVAEHFASSHQRMLSPHSPAILRTTREAVEARAAGGKRDKAAARAAAEEGKGAATSSDTGDSGEGNDNGEGGDSGEGKGTGEAGNSGEGSKAPKNGAPKKKTAGKK